MIRQIPVSEQRRFIIDKINILFLPIIYLRGGLTPIGRSAVSHSSVAVTVTAAVKA